MVDVEFIFCNLAVSHDFSESTMVSDMISIVKQYWPYVPEDLLLFGYTVDGRSHVISHDLELIFFIRYCISKGIDVVKFNIQLKICVDFVPSSSVGPSSSTSSCVSNNELAVVEYLTDDSSLIKRVPKKSDAWANILTGVGKVFESKIVCRDSVKKYEYHSGYKLDVRKSDKKRYTVQCKNKESQSCGWRFHASLVANTKGVFQCKKFHGEHSSSITGFNKYCRQMLFIDCTFITGKFKGGLMVACGKTGNQEIYQVAFGIVPCENCDNWELFLTNLKGIISQDRPLTIISDREAGLLKHVPLVFPKSYHSICLYHMKGNIPVPKGKSRQTVVKLFEECYTGLTKEKFYVASKSMSNLKMDSVIDWMVKIPFKNWVAHAFLGERFGANTSNIAESFNSVIKNDKRLPALELLDSIRAYVMEQNYKRRVESGKCAGKLIPRMHARLNKRMIDFRFYKFRRSSDKVFDIISPTGKHLVDLDAKTWTCNWWQKHSFPCTHSMKAMLQTGPDGPYKYIIPYYTTEYYRGLYARPIYLIPDSERPSKINEEGYVLPPNGGRASDGMPTTSRYRGSREKVRKKRKCGQCGRFAFHNRCRCRKALLAPRAPVFCKESNYRMINFLMRMLF
ncbi:uncharacterized protein LOC113315306 [Papaver somniferum]|uniref:uncharacterized protein LOC113315306 n=1 Tax=Papaver somniferum TaxID=3469 RepID=UPI000E6FF71B|nr:uncharacterized protein LOC113315306 [Papaver somniferum]